MTNEEIKNMLAEGVCNLTFTKLDGTTRVMRCTINENLIPEDQRPKAAAEVRRDENDNAPVYLDAKRENVIAVWDLDKSGWRSFRILNMISLERAV